MKLFIFVLVILIDCELWYLTKKGKDDNEDDGGATARVSDDDDMFDGNDEMLELDDSDL